MCGLAVTCPFVHVTVKLYRMDSCRASLGNRGIWHKRWNFPKCNWMESKSEQRSWRSRFFPDGCTPSEAVDKLIQELELADITHVKTKLYNVSRTNGGFGTWVDPSMPMAKGLPLSLQVTRPKSLEEFEPDHGEMIFLQVVWVQIECILCERVCMVCASANVSPASCI